MGKQSDNLLRGNSDAEPDASFRMVVFDEEIIIRYDGDEDTIVKNIFDSFQRNPTFQKELNKVIFNELLTTNSN